MSDIASLIEGFNAGYATVGRVMRDSELAKLSGAKVEETPGAFQPADPGAFQAQIDSGAGVGEARQLSQGPRAAPTFNYLGQSYDKAPDETAQSQARQLAMAGVFEKYGESERGTSMRQAARRDQIANEGLGMERERFGWAKADRDKQVAADAAKTAADAETAAWWNARLTGPDGAKRAPQPKDYLEATEHRIGVLAKAGRFEEAGKAFAEHSAQALATIHLEQAERDEGARSAIAGVAAGNLQAAVDWYNRFVPDGSKTTGAKVGKDGRITVERTGIDGKALPTHVYKDANELIASINAARDPMALWQYSQGALQSELARAAAGRGAAADRRAQAEFDAGKGERAGRAAIGNMQAELLDPKTTPARVAEIQGRLQAMQGVMGKGKPAGYKVEAGDVTSLLGDPAVDSKGKPIVDIMTGRQSINRNPAREQAFFRWMAENGITDTNEGLARYPGLRGEGAAPSGASSVAPPAKREVGKTYDTPRGPMTWTGAGWVPAKQ